MNCYLCGVPVSQRSASMASMRPIAGKRWQLPTLPQKKLHLAAIIYAIDVVGARYGKNI
jgi:hypothetical protein